MQPSADDATPQLWSEGEVLLVYFHRDLNFLAHFTFLY